MKTAFVATALAALASMAIAGPVKEVGVPAEKCSAPLAEFWDDANRSMNLQQVCTRGKCINFDPNNAVTSWQINNARCVIYDKKNCEQRLVTAGPDEGRDITGLKIDNDASSVRCS